MAPRMSAEGDVAVLIDHAGGAGDVVELDGAERGLHAGVAVYRRGLDARVLARSRTRSPPMVVARTVANELWIVVRPVSLTVTLPLLSVRSSVPFTFETVAVANEVVTVAPPSTSVTSTAAVLVAEGEVLIDVGDVDGAEAVGDVEHAGDVATRARGRSRCGSIGVAARSSSTSTEPNEFSISLPSRRVAQRHGSLSVRDVARRARIPAIVDAAEAVLRHESGALAGTVDVVVDRAGVIPRMTFGYSVRMETAAGLAGDDLDGSVVRSSASAARTVPCTSTSSSRCPRVTLSRAEAVARCVTLSAAVGEALLCDSACS